MKCFRSFVNIYTLLVLIFVVTLPGVYSSPVIKSPDTKVHLCGHRLMQALLLVCQSSLHDTVSSEIRNENIDSLSLVQRCCTSTCTVIEIRQYCRRSIQYSTTMSPPTTSETSETSYYYSNSKEAMEMEELNSAESEGSEESREFDVGSGQQFENTEEGDTGKIQTSTNDLVFVPYSATINNKLKNIIVGSPRNRFAYHVDK